MGIGLLVGLLAWLFIVTEHLGLYTGIEAGLFTGATTGLAIGLEIGQVGWFLFQLLGVVILRVVGLQTFGSNLGVFNWLLVVLVSWFIGVFWGLLELLLEGVHYSFYSKEQVHLEILNWTLRHSHYTSRMCLRDSLNDAVDCYLLPKVGNGYRFIHPLLLNYFALDG